MIVPYNNACVANKISSHKAVLNVPVKSRIELRSCSVDARSTTVPMRTSTNPAFDEMSERNFDSTALRTALRFAMRARTRGGSES